MSTVVKTNKDAPEDKQLLYNFTLLRNLYWIFNLFTQIIESLDCIIHFLITIDALYFNDRSKLILFVSLIFNIFSILIKWKVFGYMNPFYFLINNYQSKYLSISRIRLIQLWYRYNDIVQNFFGKARRSTNSTKNFGYLNVGILATVFIEDFGSPKPPTPAFAIHQIFESLPQSILLFVYITYYQIFNNRLYTLSILLSILSISCQIFNYFATTNNIHYSILTARFLCVITDILGTFAMFSCLFLVCSDSNDSIKTALNIQMIYIFIMKFKWITLPLSFGLSWLFVLRSIGIGYNPHHRPNIFIFIIHIVSISLLIIIVTSLSSVGLELFFNFYWFGLVIHRLFNQRFSYFDGNNNFWRRIIEWMLIDIHPIIKQKHCNDKEIQNMLLYKQKSDDRILRLFSVNTNLVSYIERFNDIQLKQWMDDIYKYVYYSYYYHDYKIKAIDFNNHSQRDSMDYKAIFKMISYEQIASYFQGHNRSTTDDIIQYMADCMESFNFMSNIIDRNIIDGICECLFQCILYFVLWIGTPLYFMSRLFNVIFPFIIMISMIIINDINWISFPFIICLCYYLCMLLLIMTWFININIFGYGIIRCGMDVSSLIYSLCPSLLRHGELYVSLKYGYFTQHELFQRILWHYNRHKYAEIEGKIVVDIFGKDLAREIFDFFPQSYSEEKISMSN